MRESSTPNTEGDFVVLLEELRNGQRSVDDFLELFDFEGWLRNCVYQYDFRCFDGSYGPEDLREVSRRKVHEGAPKLETANTPNKRAFYGWVKVLVHRTFLDALRAHKKPQNNGLSRSYEPVEIVDFRALPPDVLYERKELFRRFIAFIEDYPEGHRLAIMLWLEGESLRAIAKALDERDIECSYGAVRLWVNEILDAFKVRLGLKSPENRRRRRR